MPSKRKKDELNAQRKKQRLKRLDRDGRLANGVEMPPGAIPADISQQTPNGSYSTLAFYRDLEFTCADCGAQEVWKAKDQKWYYEIAKGLIYSRPKRCRACRKKMRAIKADQRQRMEEANRARREGNLDAK